MAPCYPVLPPETMCISRRNPVFCLYSSSLLSLNCTGETERPGFGWWPWSGKERTETGVISQILSRWLAICLDNKDDGKSKVLLVFVEMYYIVGGKSLQRPFNRRPTKSVAFRPRLHGNALSRSWVREAEQQEAGALLPSTRASLFYLFYRWISHDEMSLGRKKISLL